MQKDLKTSPKLKSKKINKLPISPLWQNEAQKWMEENDLIVEHFAGTVFRKEFFPNVARVFFDELVEYSQKVRKIGKAGIVDKLELHITTLKKWINQSHPPGADKFFAVLLLVLKEELSEIPFKNRRVILFKAVQMQMKQFTERLKEPPHCELDRMVFRGMMHAMKDRAVDVLHPDILTDVDTRSKAAHTLAKRVNEGLRQDAENYTSKNVPFPNPPLEVDAIQVLFWLASWGKPYTLLAFATQNVDWGLDDA